MVALRSQHLPQKRQQASELKIVPSDWSFKQKFYPLIGQSSKILLSDWSVRLSLGFEQLLLVHPEHEEADEDEGSKEGKQVEAMPSEVEPLQISV